MMACNLALCHSAHVNSRTSPPVSSLIFW